MRKRTTRCSEMHLTRCRTPALTEISVQQRLLKCISQCQIPILTHSPLTIQNLFLLSKRQKPMRNRLILHRLFLFLYITTVRYIGICSTYINRVILRIYLYTCVTVLFYLFYISIKKVKFFKFI